MKINNLKLALILCLISNIVFCQPHNPIGDDDPLPEPQAPINSWIIYLLIFGLLYAFFIFKKRQNTLKI